MIRTFRDRETEKIFKRQFSRKITGDIQEIALRKLRMLNRSFNLNDIRILPANCLEKLEKNREGQYSIRINDQWRICFEWHQNDAFKVEIVDCQKG